MIYLKVIFSLNLALLALDHLVTGSLALFFPQRAVKSYAKIYGAEIPATKEYFIILKPWGALGVFAGIVGLLPVFDPERYIYVIVALVILLLMRLVYRLRFREHAQASLRLSIKRNLSHVALIMICASIMIIQIVFYT